MSLTVETVEDGWFDQLAAEVVRHGGEIDHNEYGTPISVHICGTCGQRFTVCPPAISYPDCLSTACASYDPSRDAEIYFMPDDPELIER